MSPQNLIRHLIAIEKKKRDSYITVHRYIRRDFSDDALTQIHLILKKKKLGVIEHRKLRREIGEFEESIK